MILLMTLAVQRCCCLYNHTFNHKQINSTINFLENVVYPLPKFSLKKCFLLGSNLLINELVACNFWGSMCTLFLVTWMSIYLFILFPSLMIIFVCVAKCEINIIFIFYVKHDLVWIIMWNVISYIYLIG